MVLRQLHLVESVTLNLRWLTGKSCTSDTNAFLHAFFRLKLNNIQTLNGHSS